MLRSPHTSSLLVFSLTLAFGTARGADDVASEYLWASMECGSLPGYVADATSDHPDYGFAKPLSDRQTAFLQNSNVISALARLELAASQETCSWTRFTSASWSDAGLNNRLHRLARVALLRARSRYEAGDWIAGNEDIERVRIMARHMTSLSRPWEHQCFMIENMAIFTAAAYVFRMPREALVDLLERDRRVGSFAPKSRMFSFEARRLRRLADDYEGESIGRDQVLTRLDLDEDVRNFLRMASDEEVIRQFRDLADYYEESSTLMSRERNEAAKEIHQLYQAHARRNRIIAGWGEPGLGDWAENAQAICRRKIFCAVIQRVIEGERDFSTIDDPYGESNLELRREKNKFVLLSELTNPNRIDFTFGQAGRDHKRE